MKPQLSSDHLSIQEVFASTLIHSLWQGVIIVLVMWMLRIVLQKDTRLNYILSLFALLLMVLTSICTFLFLWSQNTLGYFPFSILSKILDKPDVLQWINLIWLLGSSIFFFRFLLSHFYLRKLIRRSTPVLNSQWCEIFTNLKNYYSIHKSIILLQSDRISSAFLTGVIKPVIVIPISWINQLSYKEAECILAHELSHVFNRDHWVNLFIHFTEIFFYFNPAVHILISHIKLERELKADSSACNYLLEPMLYAKLILKIEESSIFTPAFTLPFFKQKKQLKRRIESVLKIKTNKNEFTSGFAQFALALSLLIFSSLKINDPIVWSPMFDNKDISCQQTPLEPNDALKNICVATYRQNEKNQRQIVKLIGVKTTIVYSKNKNIKEIEAIKEITGTFDNSINNSSNNMEEVIAYVDESDDHLSIFQKLEKDLKEEKNNKKNIYNDITRDTEIDSNDAVNGGNWIIPRQIKYYAPVDNKTYIIIKAQNDESCESEMDWNTPGKLSTRVVYKH